MRIVLVGNSGSGKSTLAAKIAAKRGLPLLELDSIVWEPGKVAVMRPRAAMSADLAQFVAVHDEWVIEGCYGDLAAELLPHATELVFLDLSREDCRTHALARPWEPHKYASKEAQDKMLPPLLEWIDGYFTRDDQWSRAAHEKLFAGFAGKKRRIVRAAKEDDA